MSARAGTACQQRRLSPACRRFAGSVRTAATAEHEDDVRVGCPSVGSSGKRESCICVETVASRFPKAEPLPIQRRQNAGGDESPPFTAGVDRQVRLISSKTSPAHGSIRSLRDVSPLERESLGTDGRCRPPASVSMRQSSTRSATGRGSALQNTPRAVRGLPMRTAACVQSRVRLHRVQAVRPWDDPLLE